jgi:hypothetical protein
MAQDLGYNSIKKPDAMDTLEFINSVENFNDPWKGGVTPREGDLPTRRPVAKPTKPDPRTGVPFASGMPLGASRKPAGALESEEATTLPPSISDSSSPNIDWSKMNQPTGSVGMTDVGESPVSRQIADFKQQAAKPVVALKDTPDEEIQQAIDIAMSFGTGTMTGVKSRIFDKNALAQAQIMAADGVHPDVIHAKTGTFKGTDGRWRQELDDSTAKFDEDWISKGDLTNKIGGSSAKLTEVVDHPDLFKAYPMLKDVKVVFDPQHPSAHWDVTKNEIVVGEHFKADKGTLYHEIQHAVQDIEGFAKGTFPGKAVVNFKLKLQDAVMPFVDRMKELYKVGKERNLDEHESAEKKHLTHIITKFNEYAKAATDEAYQFYMKSAGETEARNVDTRILMSGKERGNLPPWYSEDLAKEHQIVSTKPNMSTAYGIREYP